MLGITGCLIHELLGVDALYPTGGLGGAAPPPIIAALAVQGRAGSVQMFSEGDIGTIAKMGMSRFMTPQKRLLDEMGHQSVDEIFGKDLTTTLETILAHLRNYMKLHETCEI